MNVLDKIAPYPTREEDVTADVMASHFAAFALMHQALVLNHLDFDKDHADYMKSVGHAVSYYGLASLLRQVIEHAGAVKADEVAKDLWLAWEDGSSVGEWCWEWLTESGIDPEAVQEAAAHAARARNAEPVRITAETYLASREKTTGRVELEICGSGRRVVIDLGSDGDEILAGLLEHDPDEDEDVAEAAPAAQGGGAGV